MGCLVTLYHAPVGPLQEMLDDGLCVGHQFEYDGQTLIVSYIGKVLAGADTVTLGLAAGKNERFDPQRHHN
jgi:hypothetical protein